jgi:phage gp29-like protein
MSIIWLNQHDYVELSEEQDGMKPALEQIATLESHPTIKATTSLLPNPDPVLVKEGLRMEVFESLEADGQVTTSMETRKLAVTGMQEAIEQGNAPDEAYNLINTLYADQLNTEYINDSMLDFRFYGYTVMEINWRIDPAGYLTPVDIVSPDHEFFQFAPNGRLMFVTNTNKNGVDALTTHPNKFILLQNHPKPKNPYGSALLSKIFWNVAFKRGGMKFWTLFMEKYGIPKLLMKYAKGKEKKKVDEMVNIAANAILDGVIAIEQGTEVELIESKSTSASSAHKEYIAVQDAYISKVITGHTGNTDSTPGKLGNDDNAENVFTARVNSDAKYIASKHNEIIRKIITLNFGANVPAPQYKLYTEKSKDVLALADMHNKIYALGYDISENRLRLDFGYDEADLIKRASNNQEVSLSLGDVPNAIVEKSNQSSGVNELVDAIQKLADESSDADTFRSQITELIGNPELMQSFQDALTATQLFSNIAGRIDAIESGE